MISMWVCVTDKGFFFHYLWLWITRTEVLVLRYSLSMLCYLLTVYAKVLGVRCNENDAVSSWTEVYIQMLSLQTRRLSFLEGVDFMNCDLTSNPPTAFKKKIKKKKNSIVQPALLEELVAGERDGNRSWNTPSGFCSMRCKSSCLSVCLSEHMLTFSYKRDMVVFFIN